MTQPVIAFIGAGNIAGCIISGLRKREYPAENIIATRRTEAPLLALQKEYEIQVMTDNVRALRQADIVIMGVKPKDMKTVLTPLQPDFRERKPLLISLAAGTTIAQLSDWSGISSIIRAMPNTPARILEGVTSLYAGSRTCQEEKQSAEMIFSSVGIIEWLPEEEAIHAYTALAGSGTAYLFMFIEALTEAGQSLGISPSVAERLAGKTVIGAAKLAEVSGQSAGYLRKQVTSPDGVTAAALDTFDHLGFGRITREALRAAVKRSKEMAKYD